MVKIKLNGWISKLDKAVSGISSYVDASYFVVTEERDKERSSLALHIRLTLNNTLP